jgi:hypothetical protein
MKDNTLSNFINLFKVFLATAIIAGFVSVADAQTGWEHPSSQALMKALKIKEPLTFCNEPVPLKEQDVRERMERELLLQLDDSAEVILWLKRANRYFPHIEKTLSDNNMPDDLKYIVIAESALKPLATSYRGAVGFWQFIESTGNRYGMKTNSSIDERRNLMMSTDAAIKYLKDLYELFGSWTLAAAAYNMGEEGLKTEMLVQKESNYYRLYLNDETSRYVFRILAAKIILSDPKKFGFSLNKEDLYSPLQSDRVEITVDNPVPIHIIAGAANTYFKVIKDLNPHIKNYYLPAGKHSILIPRGAASGFYERYDGLLKRWLAEKNKSVYTVKKGENLSSIAKRFNVSVRAIMIWNDISNGKSILPGKKIYIFSFPESQNQDKNTETKENYFLNPT